MSIGLPAHLRPLAVNRAFVSAAHAGALTCLIAAAAMVLVVQVDSPELILWPAAIAIVPMIAALALLSRWRTLFFSIAYVVVGGASTYWFAIVVLTQFAPIEGSDSFVLSLPRLALMLVGGVGTAFFSGIVWAAVGLIAAEIAIVFAALQAGVTLTPDPTSLTCFVLISGTLLVLRFGQRWVARVQPSLHRAARDEELASVRYGIESKAAAMMHDTVLNHLAAIANAKPGALTGGLHLQIERDLSMLVGEEWLAESAPELSEQQRADWQQSPLYSAIRESRKLGLEIDVSGELSAVGRVSASGGRAVGLAVKQCLVNVLKHSGTLHAEVLVFASDAEVSVMVVDGGKGFDDEQTPANRLGLANSVRKRIELASGTVTVWSQPGRGTSVMIRMPAAFPAVTVAREPR